MPSPLVLAVRAAGVRHCHYRARSRVVRESLVISPLIPRQHYLFHLFRERTAPTPRSRRSGIPSGTPSSRSGVSAMPLQTLQHVAAPCVSGS